MFINSSSELNQKVSFFLVGSKRTETENVAFTHDHTATKTKGSCFEREGVRGSEGAKQVTGSTRHKIREDAVSRPSSLTPDQFHSSSSQNKTTDILTLFLEFMYCSKNSYIPQRKQPVLLGKIKKKLFVDHYV
ncbi:uncharacterized [Lates japonicus]